MRNDEFRCDCGRLLARRVPEGIEVKCRRCGRCAVIPDGLEGRLEIELAPQAGDGGRTNS